MRPTRRLAGVLVLALIVYFYGASSGVSWLFLLSFWILALAAVAYFHARWSSAGIRAEVAARSGVPGAGSPLADRPGGWVTPAPLLPACAADTRTAQAALGLRVAR